MSAKPEKDNPNALGALDKKELAMIIVAVSIGIVLVTYSAAIVIGMTSPGTSITITGTIDLSQFQNTVFVIVGAGLIVLGITQGGKIAASKA